MVNLAELHRGMSCSVQYGTQLEKVTFQFSTADFVYMLLFGMGALLVCLRLFLVLSSFSFGSLLSQGTQAALLMFA